MVIMEMFVNGSPPSDNGIQNLKYITQGISRILDKTYFRPKQMSTWSPWRDT